MFLKMNTDDSEYVDVEGGIQVSDDFGNSSFKRKAKGKAKKKADTLEEGEIFFDGFCDLFFSVVLDLQFSSEEEMDEVPLTEMEDSKGAISISVEMPMEEPGADDDSQQAAEAMVQLGNMSYYQQNEGETNEQLMFKGHYTLFITTITTYNTFCPLFYHCYRFDCCALVLQLFDQTILRPVFTLLL